jgi:PGF-pre-PGF domain-containing protein
VGIVTEFSHLYDTKTSATTVYKTQTFRTTRTTSLPTTLTRTSTAFATTQTISEIHNETQSTTLTETLYGTMSVTTYVYIDSYISSQAIESAIIHEILDGSEGSANFTNSDQHKIETVMIAVVSNVTDVEIAIGMQPNQPSVGTNAKVYQSFEIVASNLPDQDIKSATIKFKVDRNWLSNNQVTQDKVSLYRLENGEWRELQTSFQKTDETYAYYEAVSPGLSVFAIAGQSTSIIQIPWIGSIVDLYAVILVLAVLASIGICGGIRFKRSKSKLIETKEQDGTGSSLLDVGSKPSLPETSSEPQIEERLLEYITKNGGSISLKRAADDLRVSSATIKTAISHLKSKGKLAPA